MPVGQLQLNALGNKVAPLAAAPQQHRSILYIVGRTGALSTRMGAVERIRHAKVLRALNRPTDAADGENRYTVHANERHESTLAHFSVCTVSSTFANRRSWSPMQHDAAGSEESLGDQATESPSPLRVNFPVTANQPAGWFFSQKAE